MVSQGFKGTFSQNPSQSGHIFGSYTGKELPATPLTQRKAMATDLSEYLVIGISSRALFDLSHEDEIFRTEGLKAYETYQLRNEHVTLKPGAGFPLAKAILHLNNATPGKRKTEVVVMSRNAAETSLRIFNSIEHYGLNITRAALTGGAPLAPYLHAFHVDLFTTSHRTRSKRRSSKYASPSTAMPYSFPMSRSGSIRKTELKRLPSTRRPMRRSLLLLALLPSY
jgi:hypothetical protein